MDKDALDGLISVLDNWAAFFTLLVVIGVGGELVVHVMQARANKKLIALQKSEALAQEAEIARMKKDSASFEFNIAKANKGAAEALERAAKAEENLGNAKKSAAEANERAANAEQKAGSFQLQIAQANERVASAQLELARIKTPRSLTRVSELIASLAPFKGTEYVFVSVSADEESINLLKAINEVLQKAGWKRGKSVGGFPAINVYGQDMPDFSVPSGLTTGVHVSTDSPKPIDFGRVEVKDLPSHIQAAGLLNLSLSQCISPQQENSGGRLANVETGTSTVVRVAVGKKP